MPGSVQLLLYFSCPYRKISWAGSGDVETILCLAAHCGCGFNLCWQLGTPCASEIVIIASMHHATFSSISRKSMIKRSVIFHTKRKDDRRTVYELESLIQGVFESMCMPMAALA